jgi:glycosyltransferase involved in cell wall biosynthesis
VRAFCRSAVVAAAGGGVRHLSVARVLTWHVHGNYLLYLSRAGHEFLLPVKPGRPHPYGGRAGAFPWPDNLVEVPYESLPELEIGAVLYQSREAYEHDRALVPAGAPSVYLEHDPPRESPFATRHFVRDEVTLVVHVTHFNRLMWDCGEVPTMVIEHGVEVPEDAVYTGELERGLVVVNNLASRGRRLGLDVFEQVRERVPLDLVGMGSEELGGLGEVPPPELPYFAARYRFLFNPIRWTSLGLAVCEALHVGLPVVGLATTEVPKAVENGVAGFVDTDVDALVIDMERLLEDREEALRLSEGARRTGRERYGIERFARSWTDLLDGVSSARDARSLRRRGVPSAGSLTAVPRSGRGR